MKKIELFNEHGFKDLTFSNYLVHESEFMKVINFNFKAGQQLPVHSHDLEGELTLTILEGEGEFLGENGATIPAHTGDVLVSEIAEPHGVRAITDMRVLVTIAPPI
ncbi:Cupin domain protein [Pseudodesulfovibrio profundus]|uniref:Cupin domain protein n=1 Tax=Pseudodesulfovibrio profundus TaxID=57320 RepID=A0A2C8F6F2_9BACT|nr:cupin domain-containing protein [Pseudodesulfovibrio profundus]SOB57705.1 Cupin domain protein [Pseudodesulfovibrio profundus]|tara:strand:+ start:249 stop:566 length:318 start_codon:yes stop_codon:yes gene_type:complete